MLKILLTTHHLVNYGGSELVTLDLAIEFQRMGWDVTVATFQFGGSIEESFKQQNITVVNVLNESLSQIRFDLVWSHHYPVLIKCLVEDAIQIKYLIISSLSPYEPLEAIPFFAANADLILCNSEETKQEKVKELSDIGSFKNVPFVFKNSVPSDWFTSNVNKSNSRLRRIAIISNHPPTEIIVVVGILRARKIAVDLIGSHGKHQLVNINLLNSYDAVITIGRTVQHCMAREIPVFCYDRFGGPGWLNPVNFKIAEYFNYSGRCCYQKTPSEQIANEIIDEFDQANNHTKFFSNYALDHYSLTKNVNTVLDIIDIKYDRDYITFDFEKSIGKVSQVYRNTLISRENIQITLDQSQSDLERSQSQLQHIQSELERSQSQLQHTQSELERSQSQLQIASIKMTKLENSLSVKITTPLRMVAMLIRGQFSDLTKVGISFFPQKISNRFIQIKRLSSILKDNPELLDNFGSKSKKAIKKIINGRSDLVIEGIRQNLYNKNIEETIYLGSNISVEDIIILATKHTQYIAHLLQKSLAEVGYESSLSDKFEKNRDIGQLYFVICPQMFSKLPTNFVAFQLEQSVSPRWFTPKYFSNLSQAYCIFDYSVKNIEFLLENDISYNKIFYLPIGSFRGYEAYLKSINYQIDRTDQPIEILFYGDPTCQRRQIYLEKLSNHFSVYIASEVFGEELISLICRAKVVVNIHYYEGSLLETTRIHETLSLGTPIVSESSIDIDSHTDLNGIVSFIPIGDIDAMITELHLLLTDDLQQQRRLAISQFLGQDCKFSDYFKRFLVSNDLFDYNFDNYVKDVDFIEISQDTPRLCLSLTETPLRKYGFLSKPTYGFEIVEGLRYSDGWIGCGMSYKYILNKVNQSTSNYALICEDDVVFLGDFERKISNTTLYLQQTKNPWHIFAGLIADLRPDTNILAIEEYQGIEYIYIDKMTSMVMNIYSPEIMKIIKTWDQTNKDVNTNTIDRYIESQVDLVVVTTLPYLVGHAEDKISTLWGFVNTQYSEMIEMSQKILAEKVLEYKARL